MVLPTSPAVSPLRMRMIEDMCVRRLNGKTQVGYIRAVRRLAGFLGRSPDTASAEDLRRFQLHMAEQGTTSTTINATIVGRSHDPMRLPHRMSGADLLPGTDSRRIGSR